MLNEEHLFYYFDACIFMISTVLQAMQAAELPLSVTNFNSFITGHLIAG